MRLRTRTRLLLLFLAPLVFISPGLNAAENLYPENQIIEPFRDAVYNHALNESDALQLHGEVFSSLEELDDKVSRSRGTALAYYYLGRYYHAIETPQKMASYAEDLRNKRFLALRNYYTRGGKALESYRKAIGPSEEYFRIEQNAESHRLLGELQGQMLFLGTIADVLNLGPKARRHVDAARKIDPDNVKALIQEASRMAYSPAAYGGNPEKARELYREALRKSDGDKEDLFNIYGGFAMASFQEQDDKTATNWWKEALSIYPGNVFAGGMLIFCEGESK